MARLPKGYVATRTEAHERFLSHTQTVASGCLEWTAQIIEWDGLRGGYGLAHTPKGWGLVAKTSAHRVAWLLFRGSIPRGMVVCHTCDNRLCVKVEHLFLGTASDNTQDMISKGREPFHMRSRLTPVLVEEMRTMRAGGATNKSIAAQFGLSESYTSAVTRAIRLAA